MIKYWRKSAMLKMNTIGKVFEKVLIHQQNAYAWRIVDRSFQKSHRHLSKIENFTQAFESYERWAIHLTFLYENWGNLRKLPYLHYPITLHNLRKFLTYLHYAIYVNYMKVIFEWIVIYLITYHIHYVIYLNYLICIT